LSGAPRLGPALSTHVAALIAHSAAEHGGGFHGPSIEAVVADALIAFPDVVLGGWILKLVLFIVALIVLRGQPWIEPMVFFVAVVVSVLASLVVDVVVLTRMRIPHVSDTTLPTTVEEPDAAPRASGSSRSSESDADAEGRGA